jgi:hypothetical protein
MGQGNGSGRREKKAQVIHTGPYFLNTFAVPSYWSQRVLLILVLLNHSGNR